MIYQAVSEVLAGIDAEGRAGSMEAAWEGNVLNRMDALKASYTTLSEVGRPLIDYSELATQAAYVYRYVLGHAEFIYEFLTLARSKNVKPLFGASEIRVASLGGGPASELLGLVKYLRGSLGEPQITKIHYTLIDKEANWGRVATAIARQAGRHILVELVFRTFDVEDVAAFGRPSISDADLVIASFFISEIVQVPRRLAARDNIVAMLKTMKPDALLLYKDSKAPPFLNSMREIVRRAGNLSETFEEDQQFTASAGGEHRIMRHYAMRFGYGPKLTSKAVSKMYRSVRT